MPSAKDKSDVVVHTFWGMFFKFLLWVCLAILGFYVVGMFVTILGG